MKAVRVQLEVGAKKVFATALDWPGWSRSGPAADDALDALVGYASRYKAAIASSKVALAVPTSTSALEVVETAQGSKSTDFGVPSVMAPGDDEAIPPAELRRLTGLLRACWRSFDGAAESAQSAVLAVGPRGGGRDLVKMRAHVADGEHGYLRNLGGNAGPAPWNLAELRERFMEAIAGRISDEIADRGPRGGRRWPIRYAMRRSAWHSLDHAWELEDRSQ